MRNRKSKSILSGFMIMTAVLTGCQNARTEAYYISPEEFTAGIFENLLG